MPTLRILSSLRARLVLLVLLTLTPLFALAIQGALEERSEAREATRARALALIRDIAIHEESLVEAARQVLTVFTAEPSVLNIDPAECARKLMALKEPFPGYSSFGVILPDGTPACSSLSLTPPAINLSDRSYFQRAVQSGDFSVGDYVVSRVTGKGVLTMAMPIYGADGTLNAVAALGVDVTHLGNALASAVDVPPDTTFTAFDSNGTIVARYPDPQPWVGQAFPDAELVRAVIQEKDGTALLRGLDGKDRLYAFSSLLYRGESGLYATVGIPEAAAFAAVNKELRQNLIFLGVLALLGIATAWVLSEVMILRPVRFLLATTHRIGRGDLDASSGLSSGTTEMAALSRGLDSMAAAIAVREHQRDTALGELTRVNEGLEERVIERTDALNLVLTTLETEIDERKAAQAELTRQSDQLAMTNSELDDFTYVVSHDLKEPLRAIAGFNALLLEDCGEQLDEEGHRYIERINTAALKMKHLIDELLELSRIGRVPSEMTVWSSGELARQVLGEFEFALAERGASPAVAPDMPEITCDGDRFKQVLQNLVSNAIKYGPANGGIVDVGYVENGEFFEFFVRDNGIGIEPRYQEKVFGIFERLDPGLDPASTGAGLTICRRVVEHWGGKIWVESELGQGSRFVFTYPRVVAGDEDGRMGNAEHAERAA